MLPDKSLMKRFVSYVIIFLNQVIWDLRPWINKKVNQMNPYLLVIVLCNFIGTFESIL